MDEDPSRVEHQRYIAYARLVLGVPITADHIQLLFVGHLDTQPHMHTPTPADRLCPISRCSHPLPSSFSGRSTHSVALTWAEGDLWFSHTAAARSLPVIGRVNPRARGGHDRAVCLGIISGAIWRL
ncbi:hypothetical protein P691DRAFT_297868 [Macrolepiota fuliginosa MF-IS2]|uniref:Uncharacterized protein n=1 Tax=Macrolepiota fuliginosa MF-IS2 TaxID=1400762 RepID=A0A9P5X5S0_9AGAR|nr:hypothetical protein P691DRAFT_297868 [Macrolepiota fuliginosa MF-IS2]